MKSFKQLREEIQLNESELSHPIFNKKGTDVTGARLERDTNTGKLNNTVINRTAPPLRGSFINNHDVSDHPDIEEHIGYIKKLVNSGVQVHHTAPNGQLQPVTKDNVESVADSIRTAHKGIIPQEYKDKPKPTSTPIKDKYPLGGYDPKSHRSYSD